MPWKERSVMTRSCSLWPSGWRTDGGTWEEFGNSRKSGYKIFDRCQECGVKGPP
jgi:hypothetical protein